MLDCKDMQFVTDVDGKRIGVLLGIDLFRELLDAADELDALHVYDDAKASGDEAISLEVALVQIECQRSADTASAEASS